MGLHLKMRCYSAREGGRNYNRNKFEFDWSTSPRMRVEQ